MNRSRTYPFFCASIGAIIGLVVILFLKNRTVFPTNENLLDLIIIGVSIGASMGAIADMLGKGDLFFNGVSGIISAMVYGAAIGGIMDPKFSQPIPRAIAGSFVAVIAFVFYHYFIVGFITKNKRDVGLLLYAFFGLIIGAICGAAIYIIDTIYNAIDLRYIMEANIYTIGKLIESRRLDMNIGIIISGIMGTVFFLVIGAIHNHIKGKLIAGGAILGSILLGEILQSFTGVIIGVFGGAIICDILSKDRMRSMIVGTTVLGCFGAFASAVGWGESIPIPEIRMIILPAFMIIGYYQGMIFMKKSTNFP